MKNLRRYLILTGLLFISVNYSYAYQFSIEIINNTDLTILGVPSGNVIPSNIVLNKKGEDNSSKTVTINDTNTQIGSEGKHTITLSAPNTTSNSCILTIETKVPSMLSKDFWVSVQSNNLKCEPKRCFISLSDFPNGIKEKTCKVEINP